MSERDMPHMARARLLSLRGSIWIAPLSILAATSSCSISCRVPFGPFMLIVWPCTLAVTPVGIATALLPMRDIVSLASEHRTDDFATDVLVATLVVGHHALRRRHDGQSEAVVHARQRLHRGIAPAARLRHAGDLADPRRAVEILQLDVELGAAVLVLDGGIAADIALALEHIEDARAQRRARRGHLGLVARRRVADAGDHVADRIVESHRSLLTSST